MIKTGSLVGTRRKLKKKFGLEVSTQAIQTLFMRLETKWNNQESSQKNSRGRKSVRTEESINGIKARLATPDFSIRKLSAATNVSHETEDP